MVVAAERIGQGVNSGAGRVGKSLACQHGTDKHIIAGIDIGPVLGGLDDRTAHFTQSRQGQRIR